MALNNELKYILHLVKKEGSLSQKALAERCGVSIPKAASQINELKALGYLKDCTGKSSGGRIPKLVKVDETLFYSLSIDIGMEFLRMGIVDPDGKSCHVMRRKAISISTGILTSVNSISCSWDYVMRPESSVPG